jgi:hypothetical protein
MRPHGSGKPHDLEVLVTPQLFCEVLDPLNVGRTLYEVQHILGHTQVKTTQRYAHLSHETLLAAANSATVALGAVMMPRLLPVALAA